MQQNDRNAASKRKAAPDFEPGPKLANDPGDTPRTALATKHQFQHWPAVHSAALDLNLSRHSKPLRGNICFLVVSIGFFLTLLQFAILAHARTKPGKTELLSESGRSAPDVNHVHFNFRTKDRPATLYASSMGQNIKAIRQDSDSLHIAVCIVGQVQRLELLSKAQNLVRANVGKHSMVVFGVLDSGSAIFTNNIQSQTLENCYASIEDRAFAEKFVTMFLAEGAIHVEVEVGTPRSFEVTRAMSRWTVQYREPEKRIQRVQNHLRVYTHDMECAQNAISFENTTGKRFDIMLRVRDCALFQQPLDISILVDKYSSCLRNEVCVVSKRCASWGGFSDKFWVVPRQALYQSMIVGIEDLLNAEAYLQKNPPNNSEALLKSIWEHHGLKRMAVGVDDLPVVDARCIRPGNLSLGQHAIFSPVIAWKDCSINSTEFKQISYKVSVQLMNPKHLRDATPDLGVEQESWFGFYYPSPFSADARTYLTMVRNRSSRPPMINESAEMVMYNTSTFRRKLVLGRTTAFNMPMGSRLQFVGTTKYVVYNFRRMHGNLFGSRIVDFESGTTYAEMDRAIFSLDSSGQRATSINFAHVFVFSKEGTYGYQVSDNVSTQILFGTKPIPDDDGIWAIDLTQTLLSKTILPNGRLVVTPRVVVDYMVSTGYKIYTKSRIAASWLEDCYVWLEQPRLDDTGVRIVFLARAKCPTSSPTSVIEIQDIPYINIGVFTIGWDGTDLWYAAGAPVSHFDFMGPGKNQLLLCGNEGILLTSDQLGGGVMYVSESSASGIDPGRPDRYAGHCSLSRDQPALIITDTSCTACVVPCVQRDGFCKGGAIGRHLGVLNVATRELWVFALFKTNTSRPEPLFIDLHPRFAPGGKLISLDSQHDENIGTRQWILNFEEVLAERRT